jgi:two-component system, LytTR family, sensor kinase
MLSRRVIRWALAFLGWTALGLFFASQGYLNYKYSGGKVFVVPLLKLNLEEWYMWGLLTPGIVWFARRFPFDRGRWLLSLGAHLIAGFAIAVLKWKLDEFARAYLLGMPGRFSLIYKIHLSFLTYGVIVGATVGLDYYRRYQQGELRASQLEARLAEAQLQALRMQLHPHFLFNTLNAISTLVHRDPDAADRMIARLSDLLRISLEDIGVQEVPLRQELEFLERYLDIERIRFADRLSVDMEIAPETLGARTPYLILQPLVENAIRHGIAPRSTPGRVTIRARRDTGTLILEIADDGPGLPPGAAAPAKDGVGISSTRARLEQLYGSAHRFELKNAASGGLVVTLVIPFASGERAVENRGGLSA